MIVAFHQLEAEHGIVEALDDVRILRRWMSLSESAFDDVETLKLDL